MKRFLSFKHIIVILLAVIFGNLLILNVFLLNNKIRADNQTSEVIKSSEENNVVKEALVSSMTDYCPTSCISKINEATKSLAVAPTVAPIVAQSTQTGGSATIISAQKEYFISIGSGSSTAKEWTDVPGAKVIVDGSAYGKIKEITFQASLHTPAGNQMAWARLYNVTDGGAVWNSEVKIEGGTPQLAISQPITLTGSPKVYQVQMKTQLGSTTNLSQSRIYISVY